MTDRLSRLQKLLPLVLTVLIVLVIALIYAAPTLSWVWKLGPHWYIWSAHQESTSLSTYGKGWLTGSSHFLSDAFSGDFLVFYNFAGDLVANALAGVLGLAPMTSQAILLPSLLGVLLFLSNRWALQKLGLEHLSSSIAAVCITLAGNSRMFLLWNVGRDHYFTSLLHVPFHALPLATAQSWGWVLFLPNLALVLAARESRRPLPWILAGFSQALLFYTHTLTFIHGLAVQVVWLWLTLATSDLWSPKKRRLFYALSPLFIAIFLAWSIATQPIGLGTIGFFYVGVMLALFVLDPKKAWWIGMHGTTVLCILPYLIRILRGNTGLLGLNSRALMYATFFETAVFFAPFLTPAWIVFRHDRRPESRSARLLGAAILLSGLFLGANHRWGWINHPYRFTINEIFGWALLAGVSLATVRTATLTRTERRLYKFSWVWIAVLIGINLYQYPWNYRVYAQYDHASESTQKFMEKIHSETTAVEGSKILLAPEFDYPKGTFMESLLVNASRAPAFLPDYRYLLWPTRYQNRLAAFCLLFPDFPHFDPHTALHACQSTPLPPSTLKAEFEAHRSSIFALHGIRWIASLDEPFDSILQKQALALDLEPIADDGKQGHFYRVKAPIPAISVASYSSQGVRVDFQTLEPGAQDLLLGGKDLATRGRLLIDGQAIPFKASDSNWRVARIELAAGKHQLSIESTTADPAWEKNADWLYFFSIISAIRSAARPSP